MAFYFYGKGSVWMFYRDPGQLLVQMLRPHMCLFVCFKDQKLRRACKMTLQNNI